MITVMITVMITDMITVMITVMITGALREGAGIVRNHRCGVGRGRLVAWPVPYTGRGRIVPR